jgi:hypothetical protein
MEPIIAEAEILEGANGENLGRILKADRTQLLISEFTDWSLDVYEPKNATAIYSLAAQSPTATNPDGSDIFSDSLQTGDIWGIDLTGYNFRHTVDPALITTIEGGRVYGFVYVFNSSTYGQIPAKFIWKVKGLRKF